MLRSVREVIAPQVFQMGPVQIYPETHAKQARFPLSGLRFVTRANRALGNERCSQYKYPYRESASTNIPRNRIGNKRVFRSQGVPLCDVLLRRYACTVRCYCTTVTLVLHPEIK